MAAKTVVVKKKKDPPPTNGAGGVNTQDARITQQMRVLEVVGSKNEKEDKKYSPRTEGHIRQLTDLLDCFQYSRADIAALVRRCHHDDHQIQIAVANIIEDKANHGTEAWGEVKSKKQMKEEKKIREEEERKEQEAMERELEKQRKEAEKRARKEAERQARGQRNRGGEDEVWAAEATEGGSAALPPDPAILFAGSKPGALPPTENNDDWWDGNWDSWDDNDKTSKSGKDQDWNWNSHNWNKNDDWGVDEGGNGKADEWWQEDEWKTQEKRGKKKQERSGKGGKKGQEQEQPRGAEPEPLADSADMWDMPDVNASNEGGLDQFTLGDIRLAEAADQAKAPAEPAMRTVEEIEREQFAAASSGGGQSPDRSERGRGRGRGRDGDGEKKGRGRGRDGDKGDRDKGKRAAAAVDEEGEKERLERLDRSDDPRRQPMEEVGENVTVRKHSSMGCAVVSMKDTRVREAILRLGAEIMISGIKVQMKPHTDKETKMEIPTDIFVAWGRQVEKTSPLSERELTKYFDTKHQDFLAAWSGEEEKKRAAEEAQRQLQEQQRQQAVAEEQRRAYEAEVVRRQQEEADNQRKAEEQRRLQEQARIQETQAIWSAGARAPAAGADQRAGIGASGLGAGQDPAQLTAAAQAYAQNPQAAQYAAAQHWMQTMAYHTQQQGWQQQLAQRAGMQQMPNAAQTAQMQMGAQQMAARQQDYSDALRHQAAYYAYLQAEQQRAGQSAQAAYAQQQQQQQGAYQQAGAQFGYGAAAYGAGRG